MLSDNPFYRDPVNSKQLMLPDNPFYRGPVQNVYIEQLKFLAVVCAWTRLKICEKIHERTYLFPTANNCEENRENFFIVSFKL